MVEYIRIVCFPLSPSQHRNFVRCLGSPISVCSPYWSLTYFSDGNTRRSANLIPFQELSLNYRGLDFHRRWSLFLLPSLREWKAAVVSTYRVARCDSGRTRETRLRKLKSECYLIPWRASRLLSQEHFGQNNMSLNKRRVSEQQ